MLPDSLKRDYEYLLFILSRRDYPEKKLREKLRTRKVLPANVDALIAAVREAGYFSEERFRKARARQLTRRGDSLRVVKAKVKSETGIEMPGQELDQVYEDLGTSNLEVLRIYLTKEHSKLVRSGRFDAKQVQQKLVERAMRKGFVYDQTRQILKELL